MMFNLFGIFFLTVALGERTPENYTSSNIVRLNHSLDDIGDYIYLNRLRFNQILQNFDMQLSKYRQLYTERLERINVHLDLLIYQLIQNEEYLRGLEILSDFNRKCVMKYRSEIPKLSVTKSAITQCIEKISSQFDAILEKPDDTRNALDTYITTSYETDITNCGNNFVSSSTNYTICVTSVTASANTFAGTSQKKFASQMKLADCFAEEKINRAVDCTFVVQNRTISAVTVTNVLINKCIEGDNYCGPCTNTCSNILYMPFTNATRTISNPFYQNSYFRNCVVLAKRKPKKAKVHTLPPPIQDMNNNEEDVDVFD